MNKLIICLFLSVFSVLAQAKVQVQLKPDQVNLGEHFQLILIQEGQQNPGVPDLTGLQKDFVILGTERNINYSVINGQAQSSSQWVITLSALRSGILTIPAIKLDQEESAPVTINVGASGTKPSVQPTSSDAPKEIFLRTKISDPNPYINQQVIYTVTLYNSKRLLDAEYQGPQVDNALLIPLGDGKRYQRLYHNVDYVVDEQSYAIYPQKSGPLSITSPSFTALIYDFNPRRVKSQDKSLHLMVKPIPKQFKASNWLPAQQVSLNESYEDPGHALSQGSTLIRTITLEGVGVPAQLLPALTIAASDHFSVYPEKGIERNTVKQGQLVGSTEIKITYLFNTAGKVTIPELRLAWFNTTTGKEETAVLAPRSFDVSASPAAARSTPAIQHAVLASNKSTITPPESQKPQAFGPVRDRLAWALAAFFALAWLVTFGLWMRLRRSKHSIPKKKQYKAALGRLHAACKENNPEQARDALLAWVSLRWPDASVLTLSDVLEWLQGSSLKEQVQQLSQVLYSTRGTAWRGDELWRAVAALKQRAPRGAQRANVLPPINPEG